MGILPIAIETGRFINLPPTERLCKICNSGDVEDELHFIFDCETYNTERESFFQRVNETNVEFVYYDLQQQLHYLFHKDILSTEHY